MLRALAGMLAEPITRDGARNAAHRELGKAAYSGHEPTLLDRAVRAVIDAVEHALDSAAAHAPGGLGGLVLLVLVVVALAVAIRMRVGPLARAGRLAAPVFAGSVRTAAEHRAAADACAAAGEFGPAVRERLRAIVRELETRGVVEPRPGRTADEVAHEAGALVPDLAPRLVAAARLFADVWYGGRAATAATDARMREIDAAVQTARLAAIGPQSAGLARDHAS